VYLLVAQVTNRGFIVAPRYRLLQAQARDCRAVARALGARSGLDAVQEQARASITEDLDELLRPTPGSTRLGPLRWLVRYPLTAIAERQVVLDSVRRRVVHLVPDAGLEACGVIALDRLRRIDPDAATALSDTLGRTASPEARRLVIASADELVDAQAHRTLHEEFNRQRVALWLAMVGLLGVLTTGLVIHHELTLLVGALGGFLAPVVSTLTTRTESSWGEMVLSPVGGALAAVAGLLLVAFLADDGIGVLGPVFAENSWNDPTTPVALTLALLFGFSGRLFSRLAISATSHLGGDPAAP